MSFWNGRMKNGSHNDWAVGVRRKHVGRVPRAILDVPSCLLHRCVRSTRNSSTLQFRASSDKENVLFLKKKPLIDLLLYSQSTACTIRETQAMQVMVVKQE